MSWTGFISVRSESCKHFTACSVSPGSIPFWFLWLPTTYRGKKDKTYFISFQIFKMNFKTNTLHNLHVSYVITEMCPLAKDTPGSRASFSYTLPTDNIHQHVCGKVFPSSLAGKEILFLTDLQSQ